MSVDPMSYVVPFNPNENSAAYWGAGSTPPSPADAARQRKNQKIDTKRKEGTQARQILQQNAGAPNGSPAAPPQTSGPVANAKTQDYSPEAPPQYTPPAPYQPPQFTPAKYQPPAKGLEYLGLGLSLLFPGSPIAGMAGGMLTGLQQRADTHYQRNEQNAEQQYQVQADSAKAAYEGALEKSKADFQNAQIKYQADQDLASRGINPQTKQPFQAPPLQAFMPKSIDPKTKQPVVDTSYTGYAQATRSLAQWYTQRGATIPAQQLLSQAADYDRAAIDAANNAKALQVAMINQNGASAREDKRISAEFTMLDQREAAADAREERRLGTVTPKEQANLRDEATKASADWYKTYGEVTKPRMSSMGIQEPPLLDSKVKASMVPILSRIDRDSDPAAAAEWYSKQISDPTAKQLIMDRGRVADLNRRSQGLPTIPHAFGKTGDPPPRHDAQDAPKHGNPPGLPQGAKFVGAGPSGGELWQFPDGSQHEWKP